MMEMTSSVFTAPGGRIGLSSLHPKCTVNIAYFSFNSKVYTAIRDEETYPRDGVLRMCTKESIFFNVVSPCSVLNSTVRYDV